MKFVSLPPNGSSWQRALLYTIDTESAVPEDLVVEIIDTESDSVIATKRLYGVTSAQIDVAPYLRSLCDMRINTSTLCSVMRSYTSYRIALRVGDLRSEVRLFGLESLNPTLFTLLSNIGDESQVEYGDTAILSLYTPTPLKVVVHAYTESGRRQFQTSWGVAEHSVDVVIPTAIMSLSVVYFTVDLYCGQTLAKTLRYNVVPADERTRRLCWRNERGGVESYTFPHSLRLASGAVVDRFDLNSGALSLLRSASTEYRLSSAVEPHEELERIAGIIRSPYVYEIAAGKIKELHINDRTLEYGDHGRLSQVVIGIREEVLYG